MVNLVKTNRKAKMTSKKRRAIQADALREGLWLIAAMKAAGKKNVDLSADMGLNNDNLVSQWRKGYTPMSDLQMLKAAKILGADAYAARPHLLEYKEAIGAGGILEGLAEEARQHALATIQFLRAGAMNITKTGSANPVTDPGNVHQISTGNNNKPKKRT